MKHASALSCAIVGATLLLGGCASSKPAGKTPAEATATRPQSQNIASDRLFAFGKGDVGDLMPEGREQLDTLASQLTANPATYGLVRIVGHSDRIGGDKPNMALSTRRAKAVGDYLVQRGVSADRIIATGRGSYQPVVECGREKGQALIDCLAPNRRVEITIDPPR